MGQSSSTSGFYKQCVCMTIHKDQNVYTHTTDSLWVVALWESTYVLFKYYVFYND